MRELLDLASAINLGLDLPESHAFQCRGERRKLPVLHPCPGRQEEAGTETLPHALCACRWLPIATLLGFVETACAQRTVALAAVCAQLPGAANALQ